MPSMQSVIILSTALLGSLLPHAAAAPEAISSSSKRAGVQLPQCISTCMRNSGCFDTGCVCKKADDGILSDIVICMNQWCPADVTAADLIGPLEGQCDLPKAAVQDAEKKGGVVSGSGSSDSSSSSSSSDDDDNETSSAKPTPTGSSSSSSSGGKDGKDNNDDEVIMTFEVGSPVTAAAEPSSSALTPNASGTPTRSTDATPTPAGGKGKATPTGSQSSATPSSSAGAGGSDDDSADDKDNAADVGSHASVFGVVAAMAVALALGF
ncbi:hypothetical protein F5Y14DRAFT_411593 [Nemania sp. NC0429]|nr:hypothetical protein F5Y14DRAFT_411593 [Nemania sp. NC0429]